MNQDPETIAAAERAVLGGIMLHNPAAAAVRDRAGLVESDFADPRHRLVYGAMLALLDARKGIDPLTLAGELTGELTAAGGLAYLSALNSEVPSTANIMHYAAMVQPVGLARRIKRTLAKLAEGPDADEAVSAYAGRVQATVGAMLAAGGVADILPIADVLEGFLRRLDNPQGDAGGVPTGIGPLDEAGILWPREVLSVVGARPGTGKSALLVQTAWAAAERGVGVLIVSLEDAVETAVIRCLAQVSGVNGDLLMRGAKDDIGREDWARLTHSIPRITTLPIWYDARRAPRADRIVQVIRAAVAAHPEIGLVLVDHAQELQVDPRLRTKDRRGLDITTALSQIREVTAELKVATVVASQINREGARSSDGPSISDLKETGGLEELARCVLLLHRPEQLGQRVYRHDNESWPTKGLVVVKVAKRNYGAAGGAIPLHFHDECLRFDPYDAARAVHPAEPDDGRRGAFA